MDNVGGPGKILRVCADEEMALYDSLPPEVRRVMSEAPVDFAVEKVVGVPAHRVEHMIESWLRRNSRTYRPNSGWRLG